MMSSQEMWFATSKLPPECGRPSTCSAMPINRSSFSDHQRVASWRCATL